MYNISNKFSFLRLWAVGGDDSNGEDNNSIKEPFMDDFSKPK